MHWNVGETSVEMMNEMFKWWIHLTEIWLESGLDLIENAFNTRSSPILDNVLNHNNTSSLKALIHWFERKTLFSIVK